MKVSNFDFSVTHISRTDDRTELKFVLSGTQTLTTGFGEYRIFLDVVQQQYNSCCTRSKSILLYKLYNGGLRGLLQPNTHNKTEARCFG